MNIKEYDWGCCTLKRVIFHVDVNSAFLSWEAAYCIHHLYADKQAKLLNMPMPARAKMQETLERVINEGCSGLICILL